MMKRARTILSAFAVAVLALGCGKSSDAHDPPSKPSAPTPSVPTPAVPAVTQPSAPPAAAGDKLACDEDRYQKWLAMKKELNAALASGLQETGKKVDAAGKDSASGKAEAFEGLAATGKDMGAIRAKYGFEPHENSQWQNLASTVSSMRPLDSPMAKGMIDMYRKMQAGPDQQKATADKFFHDEEEKGKKAEAKARERFGDACVDLMLKHSTEVLEMQMASANAVLGGGKRSPVAR